MHDVSELRPLGFMMAVYGEAFYIIVPSRGWKIMCRVGGGSYENHEKP